MEEEQNRLHRDHTIAELLGADRRRRSRPRPAGAPAGTPVDCARKLRSRFVATIVLFTAVWATAMCAFVTGFAGNYLLYPYATRDPARERAFDALPLWFGVVAVAGPLLIALIAAFGRLPWIAVVYAAVALLCALLAHGLAGYADDFTPEKPEPTSQYVVE
ncbi:hypothetical protein [Phytomonospora endophytica]|uniref:Uncharacterized protein n=1 Tax=Phytomonospora endophytica TaxID=714109 RepID=A0A841FMA1_9ACTN|nr:hypothetical protein [Phytomonospora endophytica]MBB6037135.1 hypothetical protein [Phytomonospora endophytica]GIG71175.1 hypothetical protein Pen01_74700 [Phytomonospora endophytica]